MAPLTKQRPKPLADENTLATIYPGGKPAVVDGDPSKPMARAPGQKPVPKSINDQWVLDTLPCDRDATQDGCILDDVQRVNLVIEFKDRVQQAMRNYQDALGELRFDELLKKDEDLGWFAALVLDVIATYSGNLVGKVLKGLKPGLPTDAMLGSHSLASDMTRAVANVSDESIKGNIKAVFAAIKGGISKRVKTAQNQEALDDKTATVSYTEELRSICEKSFPAFASAVLLTCDDTRLWLISQSFDPAHGQHSKAAYKAALDEKLGRFRKSGVRDIGTAAVRSEPRSRDVLEISRATRVVWVEHADGRKELWYESATGITELLPDMIVRESAQQHDDLADGWVPGAPSGPAAEFHPTAPVPPEFIDVALGKSIALWGPVRTVSPARSYARSVGGDLGPPATSTADTSMATGGDA